MDTVCDRCGYCYSDGRGVGARCGDLSQFPPDEWFAYENGCWGRLISEDDYRRRQEATTMRVRTEFFKDGDALAIRTNASNEADFVGSVAQGFADMVDRHQYDGDWEFQFERWIPNVIEIACRLRGYKAIVDEQRVITAGSVAPNETARVFPLEPEGRPAAIVE